MEEKNVGKGHQFQRVILAGTFEWRGTLAFSDSEVGTCCRGTQIILISSIYGMRCYGNFAAFLQPNYEKKGLC